MIDRLHTSWAFSSVNCGHS